VDEQANSRCCLLDTARPTVAALYFCSSLFNGCRLSSRAPFFSKTFNIRHASRKTVDFWFSINRVEKMKQGTPSLQKDKRTSNAPFFQKIEGLLVFKNLEVVKLIAVIAALASTTILSIRAVDRRLYPKSI
jgi:hypothetical protein